MFGLNYLASLRNPQPVIIAPGTRVICDTLCYGTQIGVIEAIVPSPFLGEEGIDSAFVVGDGWTDYIPVETLDLDTVLDADPEYIQWIYELEATAYAQELAD